MFRRYDVRKGKVPPVGSTPAGTNDDGDVEFYWIDVTEDKGADNQYYQSSLGRKEGKIETVAMILPDGGGKSSVVMLT